ncbi:MAG: right-handed parallel beta-helix repeat-containing protein, partial [Candidatus Hydrogenedentes bacterium]|nr:right-handed parallel beta-helix repeat-containing protein [Candidatus Hydrogenedentota bacterium]
IAGDYPKDSDFFYADGSVMETNADTQKEVKSNTQFRFRKGDIKNWKHLEDAVFVVFHSWATSLHRVKNIDMENRVLEFTGPARWPFTRWKENQWYFVEHLLDALETPGEWCLNRSTNTLHYIPLPGETPDTVDAVIPVTRQFLLLKGEPDAKSFVSHLHFKGLVMKYGDWPVGPAGHSDGQAETSVEAAVQAVGARHCLFEDCEISHVGSYGIWLRSGSQHNTLRRCALMDLGAGGVRIGEGGDPPTPAHITGYNKVDNCLLHDGGRIYRSAVGVWIGRSSHNTISHNDICDFRYSGVSVGWSWGYAASSANNNIIEYNHIHDLGKAQLSDMGGIYTLGVSPGTVLRNNYIHDILSNPKVSGGWGLYTDEGSTDILLSNNVVYNTRTGGFHQHYGKENRVVNNILAFSQRDQIIRSRDEEHISFFFKNNIVYFKEGNLLGSTWKNGNFVLDNNCYWDASGKEITFSGKTFEEWNAMGQDKNSRIADPKFNNIIDHDFSLKADSPALALGFNPIDISDVGLYGDIEWTDRAKQVKR